MTDALLVGSNLALLVAATELVRRGRAVTWLTDGKPPGGHFAGMTLQDLDFDIGMVLLEQIVPTVPCDDLRDYRSDRRNDWTRFGHLASAWLKQQQTLRRVPTPECRLDGRVWPDYLIANRLDAFANGSTSSALAAPDGCTPSDPRHPSHKLDGTAYDTLDYAEAAHVNHGQALHDRCIAPFLRKLLGMGSADFLARFHRAAWVPLYYPETLRAAQQGHPVGLAEYPFWTTRTGFVGQLVRDLRAMLQAAPGMTMRTEPLITLAADATGLQATIEGDAWHGRRCALGLPGDRCRELLSLAPAPQSPAASVSIAFARVRADAIGRPTGCQMVVDDDCAAYRLSDQDAMADIDSAWHRVTIEASPERLAQQHPGMPAEQALARELCMVLQVEDAGAVQVLKLITARNALTLPTAQAVAAADAHHTALQAALPAARLSGALLGHGAASLNDQIVQGLKIAEELS